MNNHNDATTQLFNVATALSIDVTGQTFILNELTTPIQPITRLCENVVVLG